MPSATSRSPNCSGDCTYSLISVIETNDQRGTMRRAERAGHEALVDAVDLERIGVEQHHAEVGLVAADDRRLQAERRIRAGRIKCRN